MVALCTRGKGKESSPVLPPSSVACSYPGLAPGTPSLVPYPRPQPLSAIEEAAFGLLSQWSPQVSCLEANTITPLPEAPGYRPKPYRTAIPDRCPGSRAADPSLSATCDTRINTVLVARGIPHPHPTLLCSRPRLEGSQPHRAPGSGRMSPPTASPNRYVGLH